MAIESDRIVCKNSSKNPTGLRTPRRRPAI
jgi:hypothetical protein